MSSIVILSLWRNDSSRRLQDRVNHLLSKRSSTHTIRWVWIVGDSVDNTYSDLISARDYHIKNTTDITVIYTSIKIFDDGTLGSARIRSSLTASVLFKEIYSTDDYVLLHESDLVSSDHVIDDLFASSNHMHKWPMAGWPTIHLNGRDQFYDIWAYRDLEGVRFRADTQLSTITEVSSFGSVWLAPASFVKDRVIKSRCIVELCEQWCSEGIRLFVDPSIPIEQPVDLWMPM